MTAKKFAKVYVITDHSNCYVCNDYGEQMEVYDDPALLMDTLLLREVNVALFIDVKYYIKLGPEARNRLMAVAQGVPLFRIRYDKASAMFTLIDDPYRYSARNSAAEALNLRSEERVPVQLNVELAKEDDPFLHAAMRSNIVNVSCSGCFVYCVDTAPYRGFVYVRIHELSNKRPIYCTIRWRRDWGVPDNLPGLGLQFVDIKSDQIQELQDMYVTPYLQDHEQE